MIAEALGQRLHDRATRGEALNDEERSLLKEWYAQQDQQEIGHLKSTPITKEVQQLQALLENASAQLITQAERIHTLTVDNATLQREIAALQTQLQQRRAVTSQ